MSEFETRFSGMKQAADQEKRLASEVTEIESEVRNVMNNLQIRSSAMAEIKRKLNGNLQNVSTAKQRLQVLSSALEEITALYQNAAQKIIPCPANRGSTQRNNWSMTEKGSTTALDECLKFGYYIKKGFIDDFEI